MTVLTITDRSTTYNGEFQDLATLLKRNFRSYRVHEDVELAKFTDHKMKDRVSQSSTPAMFEPLEYFKKWLIKSFILSAWRLLKEYVVERLVVNIKTASRYIPFLRKEKARKCCEL